MPVQHTTETFVSMATTKHGGRYIYDKVKYKNAHTKVTITCMVHGDWEQVPGSHLYGRGCPQCAGNLKSNTSAFVQNAKKIHGNKYDYALVNYKTSKDAVEIICQIHGVFLQTPYKHCSGAGCPKCIGRNKTTQEFVDEARLIHGDTYDYSKVVYVSSKEPVTIICPHKEFTQTPNAHLMGQGCCLCSGKRTNGVSSGRNSSVSFEEFVLRAQALHGKKYDYSKMNFVSMKKKVDIYCAEHGCFSQSPKDHLAGCGCPVCAGKSPRVSYEEFCSIMASKSFSGQQEYKQWHKATRPIGVPQNPDRDYPEWTSWAFALGYRPLIWTKPALLHFLQELKSFIPMMDAGDLMALARQSHIPKSLIRTNGTSDGLVNRLRDLCAPEKSDQEKLEEFESIQSEIANNDLDVSGGDWSDDVELFETDEPEVTSTEADATLESTLTPYVGAEELKMLNGFIERYFSESETIQYLISKRVNRLWYELFHTDDFETIDKKLKDGECQLVTDAFMAEYDGANSIDVPDGFSYTNGQVHVEPNWMQKLTAWKLQERKRIGNWSGVGAGKTLSAIFAGRRLNLKTTVVIANNNTIDGWHKAITTFFPASHVVEHNGLASLTANGFRYVIVNYEKFQLAKSKTLVEHLLATFPDFIVVDELQSVKNRAVETESRRRKAVNMFVQQATEQNPDLHVLGMSATPCVNNLQEIRGLLELITGKDLSHMSTRPTWANASAFHEMLVCNGLRYRPDYAKGVEPVIVPVDGAPWLKELLEIDNNPNNVLRQEQVLCKIKLDEIVSTVIPGTIIYTHYVDGLVPMLKTACESAGFRVGCFTGNESELEKKESKERFLDGIYDVLIGSSAIGTGVDGLQRVCSRLIFACLPWTNAEFEQIVGRVFRQGRMIDKVDVVIPQVEISLGIDEDGKPLKWSRDIERMNIILSKRTLMDCAIDGVRPTQDLEKEHKMAKKGLEAMMKRISADQDTSSLSTTSVAIDSIDDKESAVRNMGAFTVLNRRWSTMKSDTLHKQLVQKPSEWRRYHKLLSEARQTWTEIPFEVIAKQIKRNDWLVADLGCGEALFAQSVPNTVHSYDHVAINDSVIACDISNVPSADEVYDAVVMSLVCMGANWPDYIAEAHRILKPHGLLFVAEPLKGQFDQQERIDEIANSITKKGFGISSRDLSGGFVYFKALKA